MTKEEEEQQQHGSERVASYILREIEKNESVHSAHLMEHKDVCRQNGNFMFSQGIMKD